MARPEWLIVLRGYDRDEVDTFLDGLESATTRPAKAPTFGIALRGYDRKAVDAYLEKALAALPATPGTAPPA